MNGRSALIGLVSGDPVDGAVRQILVEMHRLAIWLGGVVIPHDRHELVNVGRHVRVGMLETFTAGPAIERTDLGHLVERRVVPLAQRIVHIPFFLKVVGHRLG